MVETAEALTQAHRFTDCISLCEEFLPYFMADDDDLPSVASPCDTAQFHDSFSSLAPFQNGKLHTNITSEGTPFTVKCSVYSGGDNMKVYKNLQKSDKCLKTGLFRQFCGSTRKRKRTSSLQEGSTSFEENKQIEERELNFLAVRLLICQTDCLVGVHGYTEDPMVSLKRAYNILLESNLCATNIKLQDSISSPCSKRQKVDKVADKADSSQIVDMMDKLWTKQMIGVSIRMGKLSLKRKLFPSVLSSCHLVLQLDESRLFAVCLLLAAITGRLSCSTLDSAIH